MSMIERDVVVVGAGMAAAALAIALRQKGFQGSVAIVGREDSAPYDRPALSKDYLTGERSVERLLMRSESFWQQNNIELLTGRCVAAVDAAQHRVQCSTGEILRYRTLVWAAGSEPRSLEIAGLPVGAAAYIRSRQDIEQLRSRLPGVRRVAIAGAGFIGLEAAPGLLKLGKEVVLIDSAPRLLERKVAPVISAFLADMHATHGAQLRLGVGIDRVLADAGGVQGLCLSDGSEILCDLLISAVGTRPLVEPLRAAGAKVADGVCVDAFCRTSLPDVYAVGDCAAQESRYAGGVVVRIESVQHATDQAKAVAHSISGTDTAYGAFPWFWSNQHSARLQTAGLSMGYDMAVTRGNPSSGKFSVCYLRQGKLVAVDCINQPRDFTQSRPLIEAGATLSASDLANADRPLAELSAH